MPRGGRTRDPGSASSGLPYPRSSARSSAPRDANRLQRQLRVIDHMRSIHCPCSNSIGKTDFTGPICSCAAGSGKNPPGSFYPLRGPIDETLRESNPARRGDGAGREQRILEVAEMESLRVRTRTFTRAPLLPAL